jgi:HNH endonuclease
MSPQILKIDIAGVPHSWLTLEEAAHYYASEQVAWEAGTTKFVLRGGRQASGNLSLLRMSSIIAIAGYDYGARHLDRVPPVSKDGLLKRDRYMCAYCAQVYRASNLEMEHILPVSRGGQDTWKNLVTACCACNDKKGARKPEEAGMKLHYVPYEPNYWEGFILRGRSILADQMEFLRAGLPKHSRLLPQ